jgi:hypothetical protein
LPTLGPDILLWLLGIGFFAGPTGPQPAATQILLEDFQSYAVGSVPSGGWSTRGGEAKGVYSVQDEKGDRYLKAVDAAGRSVQFFRGGGWSVTKYPCLRWKWRAIRFPAGADERIRGKNDSAAGVYVVFPKRFFAPESIKYVWSEKVPVDVKVARNARFPIIVVRSGTADQGKWVTETRNVREDFEKHFGRKPADPVAIGFLTDSNDTHGVAEADYDDFRAVISLTAP